MSTSQASYKNALQTKRSALPARDPYALPGSRSSRTFARLPGRRSTPPHPGLPSAKALRTHPRRRKLKQGTSPRPAQLCPGPASLPPRTRPLLQPHGVPVTESTLLPTPAPRAVPRPEGCAKLLPAVLTAARAGRHRGRYCLCPEHEDRAAVPSPPPGERARERGRRCRTAARPLCRQLPRVLGGKRQGHAAKAQDSAPGTSEHQGWANGCFCTDGRATSP